MYELVTRQLIIYIYQPRSPSTFLRCDGGGGRRRRSGSDGCGGTSCSRRRSGSGHDLFIPSFVTGSIDLAHFTSLVYQVIDPWYELDHATGH